MGSENYVDPGGFGNNYVAVLLGKATSHGYLQGGVFLLLLKEDAQIAIELVVCVFANGAGVEHHDV